MHNIVTLSYTQLENVTKVHFVMIHHLLLKLIVSLNAVKKEESLSMMDLVVYLHVDLLVSEYAGILL